MVSRKDFSNSLSDGLDAFDVWLVDATKRVGLRYLRYSVAIVFIWFGALKIFGVSPANAIVVGTATWFDPSWFLPTLGVWEVVIGVCFIYPRLVRLGILMIIPQMIGTFLPFIALPHLTVQGGNILTPTLEGQYIIKNFVIICAAMVIGSHVRDDQRKAHREAVIGALKKKR